MAITNYTELQTAMTNWLSRTNDTNLQSLYADFITFAEAKFNRGLRTTQMETATSLVPASGICTLPTDYLELRRLYLDTDTPVELEYLPPEQFYLKFPIFQNDGSNPSRYYTLESNTIVLSAQDTNQSVVILYYKKIPALSSNSTNWLLSSHPDLYLAEALSEAYDVIKNDAMAQKWANKALFIADQLISSDKRGKYAGSAMRVIAA